MTLSVFEFFESLSSGGRGVSPELRERIKVGD